MKSSLLRLGSPLVLIGVLGLAAPVFTTSRTKDVVKMGNMKIQTTEEKRHVVPTSVSTAAVILGAILLSAGLYRRR
jgi:hypothetical protein